MDKIAKVKLTKKLAERMDGVDVSHVQPGDLLHLPAREAAILVAEEWAVPVHDNPRASAERRDAESDTGATLIDPKQSSPSARVAPDPTAIPPHGPQRTRLRGRSL